MNLLLSCRHPLLALFLALTLVTASHADSLAWTQQAQSFTTEFGDEEISASYPFTNAGPTAVTITETSASCGCTVPNLDKQRYEPGESGELTAVFAIGSRQGQQRKLITVVAETSDGETQSYELELNVDIPVPVTLKPRVRFWKQATETSTQEIEVTFHEKFPMTLTGLARRDESAPDAFAHEIVVVEEGHRYLVKLTPLKPELKSREVFTLVSDTDEKDVLSRYPVYAYIR